MSSDDADLELVAADAVHHDGEGTEPVVERVTVDELTEIVTTATFTAREGL